MCILFIEYLTYSTCREVKKYLQNAKVELEIHYIVEEIPTIEEPRAWVKQNGLGLKEFFNTSGNVYKELELKDCLEELSEEGQLNLPAGGSTLIKRPLLIYEKGTAVGFREERYKDLCSEWQICGILMKRH